MFFIAQEINFLDFCKSHKIPIVHMRIFNSPNSRYGVIVGRDLLAQGFILNHATNTITWDGLTVPMHNAKSTSNHNTTSFSWAHSATEVYANQSPTIFLHVKYDRTLPEDVVQKCTHLTPHSQSKLLNILTKIFRLFSGKLGRYVHKQFSIHLKDPTTPLIFCNPYPVPMVHQKVFKQELQHLIDEKVLQRISRSEWAFPTFLIPKKDGRVRWISNFCELNKLLKRARYFLPSIPTTIQRRAGFSFITKLDVSLGFYTFELSPQAQKDCVISTPLVFTNTFVFLWA